ncbi:MAG: hypothetical protein IJO46_10545, partial [Thermoguttaceae bacterium]|nr:hypothetical protein [Thermoguttaceae bacterium]
VATYFALLRRLFVKPSTAAAPSERLRKTRPQSVRGRYRREFNVFSPPTQERFSAFLPPTQKNATPRSRNFPTPRFNVLAPNA